MPSVDDAELTLLATPSIGPVVHARLLATFGSAAGVLGASVAALGGVQGLGPARAASIRRSLDQADPRRERELVAAAGAEIVLRADPRYPPLLATIADPPSALWVRGNVAALQSSCVAVVGARRCTLYGREQATRLATGLVECGFAVVSGGARGIDAAAHRAALRAHGVTIAVLGCGLGCCYPPEHGELFEAIASPHAEAARRPRAALSEGQDGCSGPAPPEHLPGCLVSELPMLYPPRADAFPRRNRIISGLSLGVIVIEAALRSGALITAREAAESHHREVMALPGPVDSAVSAGCHRALREGWAGLVTGLDDVLAQLAPSGMLVEGAALAVEKVRSHGSAAATSPITADPDEATPDTASRRARPGTAAASAAVLAALGERGALDASGLAASTGLGIGEVLGAITLHQLAGRVVRANGAFRLSREERR